MKAEIIVFANHKGGVGKTTSVGNIGYILSSKGKKVLLIDLDAQANLSLMFMNELPDRTIYDALIERKNAPIYSIVQNLDIVPSTLKMINVEQKITPRRIEYILSDLVKDILFSYDYILIDCPPSLGLMTTNALTIADKLYVPMLADMMSLLGVNMIADFCSNMQDLNDHLKINGIFINQWLNTKLSQAIEQQVRDNYGDLVFKQKIRTNTAVKEAALAQMDVTRYSGSSNGAIDFMNLVKEMFDI